MIETILSIISDWAERSEDRAKLQHVYLMIAAVLLVVAGLASLLNSELGHTLVAYSLGALGIFTINAVVWAIIYTAINSNRRAPAAKRTKK